MSTTTKQPPLLGRCPECAAEIQSFDVEIKYESDDGQMALWATCPGCGEIVHPQ